MNQPGWVIKGGYAYCLKKAPPATSDTGYPVGSYLWIDTATNVAYVLNSIEDGRAVWAIKQPDSVINSGTGGQINVIGESYLGNAVTVTPGAGTLSSDAVISIPSTGEKKITNIRVDSNNKLVVTHE